MPANFSSFCDFGVTLSNFPLIPNAFYLVSEEVKIIIISLCVCTCSVTTVMSALCDPKDCSPSSPSVHGILQVRILECVAYPPLGDLLGPGIEPTSPESFALQVDSLPTEPPGKSTASLCSLPNVFVLP